MSVTRTVCVLLGLLLAAPVSAQNAERQKAATYVTGDGTAAQKKVIGNKLVEAIIERSNQYSAVERTDAFLAMLSKEHSYQRSGAVDNTQIAKLGLQMGVQAVVVAEVSLLEDSVYLAARIVDVKTAEIVKATDDGAISATMIG